MNKLCFILLFILSSCSELEKYVEEEKVVNNIDSIMILADEAIISIKKKNKQSQIVQNKLNQKVLDIIYVRNFYEDSIDNLRQLKLIDRDSIIYNYNIELVTITDTVRVTLSDSVCNVCLRKLNNRKSIFNIFKKKEKK